MLSAKGCESLKKVMVELEIDRPSAIRLAFAKGIAAEKLPSEEKRPIPTFEFNSSVVAKGNELILMKHLIRNRLQRKLEPVELDNYILFFVEHGLEEMITEIEQISDADNYLFFLLDKHK